MYENPIIATVKCSGRRTSIVDHEHFDVTEGLVECGLNRLVELVGAIMSRNNDRELGHGVRIDEEKTELYLNLVLALSRAFCNRFCQV